VQEQESFDDGDVADVKNFSGGNLVLPLNTGNAPQSSHVKLVQLFHQTLFQQTFFQ